MNFYKSKSDIEREWKFLLLEFQSLVSFSKLPNYIK